MFRSTYSFLEKVIGNKELLNNSSDNRHLVCYQKKGGSISEVYFGVPIRKANTNDIVKASFLNTDAGWSYFGTNSFLSLKDHQIHFCDGKNDVIITVQDRCEQIREKEIQYQKAVASPTLNGLLFDVKANRYTISINSVAHFDLRVNDRFVALLGGDGKPILTVSCQGAYSCDNAFLGMCKIEYKQDNIDNVDIAVFCEKLDAERLLFEVNMFEEKLIEDTTVESRNPILNNVYGSLAIVGKSLEHGEQWLYSKINFSKLNIPEGKSIHSLRIYYPKHSHINSSCSVHKLENTFCSFGAIWDKKVDVSHVSVESTALEDFYCIDVTDIVVENDVLPVLSYVIRSKGPGSPISTGDNYAFPPFLELDYY